MPAANNAACHRISMFWTVSDPELITSYTDRNNQPDHYLHFISCGGVWVQLFSNMQQMPYVAVRTANATCICENSECRL